MVTLHDGRNVCNTCPEWREECEARELLALPLMERRERLSERDIKRGQAETDELRDRMSRIHSQGKAR